jgi:PAS domain S-box-containing protein
METACASGGCSTTGRIVLSDTRTPSIAIKGLCFYLPVYRTGDVPISLEKRRQELTGFVYADFDCRKLFSNIFGTQPSPLVGCAVYASEKISPDQLIYGDPVTLNAIMPNGGQRIKQVVLKLLDRPWTFYFTVTPAFALESQEYLPNLALICWLVLSFLLFGITYAEVKDLARAEKITRELRRSERELSEEKERLAVTLYSIGDGVITMDTEANVVSMNKAAEKLTGFADADSRGKPLADLLKLVEQHTRAKVSTNIESTLKPDVSQIKERPLLLIRKDGSERVVTENICPVRNREGKLIGAVVVIRDITERQKSDAELLKESKLESVGLLAGGIAHDFNNILQGIIGNLSLARMNAHSTEKLMERLAGVEKSAMRAKDLTQQLVMFARGGAPIRRRVQLNTLVKDSTLFVLHGSNVTCEFSLPLELWHVEVDEGQMRQVINNIVLNAVQSMPAGGKMEVRAGNVEITAGFLSPLAAGNYVKITIRDHGTGIADATLPKIFDPYFTTRKHARGLGLASAYSVVRKHDGQITVETVMGRGSDFHIYLPASVSVVEPVPHGLEQKRLFEQGRVLVMDDEEVIQDLAKQMLEMIGFQVSISKDGAEALKMYAEAKESGRPFAVVIMDLTIPEGMGGREAIRRLRDYDPKVKAIVSSGYSYDPVMANFRQFGFNGVMPKPYVIDELRRVMQEVLGSDPSGEESSSQPRLI